MFISLNPTLLAGSKVGWPQIARLAARTGYPGVDLALGPAMAGGVEAAKALFQELRIRPAATGMPVEFRKDEATFEQGMAKLEAAARFVEAIGCPRMVTWIQASSDKPKDELRALFLKRFRAIAAVLARFHVAFGLEFLGPQHLRTANPHEFVWKMNDMLELAKESGPNVGLLLDAWHWHHAGAKAADIVAAGRQRIVHVHVSDSKDLPADQIRDNDRLMPGEGVIDLVGFFRALQQIGYPDAVSVEVFGRGLKEMAPEQAARLGFETARKAMEKAGVPWNA